MGTMIRKVKIFLPTIILVAIVKKYSNIQRKINIGSEKEGSDCDFHIGMPRWCERGGGSQSLAQN